MATKLLPDIDFGSIPQQNIFANAGFEYWLRGTSLVLTATAVSTPVLDGWSGYIDGSGGSSITFSRDAATKDTGGYSCSCNLTSNAGSSSNVIISQSVFAPDFNGRTVTISARVKASASNLIRLRGYDGNGYTYSSYHSGSGSFETLSVTFLVTGSYVGASIGILGQSASVTQWWVDSVMATVGSLPSIFLPLNRNNDLLRCGIYSAWRRPVLQYGSSTTLTIENGNYGLPNTMNLLFPDGEMRADGTSSHVILDFTRVATLTGSKQSGLRTGSVSNNQWYFVYGVKAQDNSTDFVLIGDTTPPYNSFFSTLDGYWGRGNYLYLGPSRIGDNAGSPSILLPFWMSGNRIAFINAATINSQSGAGNTMTGIRLATAGSATGLTYNFSQGTGAAQIPGNILLGTYSYGVNISSGSQFAARGAISPNPLYTWFAGTSGSPQIMHGQVYCALANGLLLSGITSTTTGAGWDILLSSFEDSALSANANVV